MSARGARAREAHARARAGGQQHPAVKPFGCGQALLGSFCAVRRAASDPARAHPCARLSASSQARRHGSPGAREHTHAPQVRLHRRPAPRAPRLGTQRRGSWLHVWHCAPLLGLGWWDHCRLSPLLAPRGTGSRHRSCARRQQQRGRDTRCVNHANPRRADMLGDRRGRPNPQPCNGRHFVSMVKYI